MQEMQVRSLGREYPQNRKWQLTPVFWPGKFCEQRSLVGYGPWGCKESDMTEQNWADYRHIVPCMLTEYTRFLQILKGEAGVKIFVVLVLRISQDRVECQLKPTWAVRAKPRKKHELGRPIAFIAIGKQNWPQRNQMHRRTTSCFLWSDLISQNSSFITSPERWPE